jgi:exopolysaccharide biosynthesis polyprenyl glycosylphosphotransferase
MPVVTTPTPPMPVTHRVQPEVRGDTALASLADLKRTPHLHYFEFHHSLVDLFISFLSTLAILVYFTGTGVKHERDFAGHVDWGLYWPILIVYPALVIACCRQQRLYRRLRNLGMLEDTLAVGKAVFLAIVLFTSGLFLLRELQIARPVIIATACANIVALVCWRAWIRKLYERKIAAGQAGINVIIVGADKVGRALAEYLETNHHLGYVVKGFLDQSPRTGRKILGSIEDLPRVAREQFADEIFVTISAKSERTKQIILDARKSCLDVTVVPELFEGLGFQAPLEYVGEFPVMELHREPIPTIGLVTKRVIDILLVTVGMVVAVPLIALFAIAIYIDSPGPVFYTSQRVGKKGRVFGFHKLRSMVTNAESKREELEIFNEREGALFKMKNDPRITRVGRFLRKYSLDELPQMWNVFKGEMSLVGPRPPLVSEYAEYKLEHRRRLDVVPGISGLWQVSGRKDPSFEGYLALDLKYIENWNLLLDLEILLRTIPAVLRGTGH